MPTIKRRHSADNDKIIKAQKTSQSNVQSDEEVTMKKQNVSQLTKTEITSRKLPNSFNS